MKTYTRSRWLHEKDVKNVEKKKEEENDPVNWNFHLLGRPMLSS